MPSFVHPRIRSLPSSARRLAFRLMAMLALSVGMLGGGAAHAQGADVPTAWRLLDYVAVDYAGAVADGKVKSASEYAEMREFGASISERIAALPPSSAKGGLVAGAARLRSLIAAKGQPEDVAWLAHGLAADLLKAYPIPLAPARAPDLSRGATLFAQNCASCHGMNGDGRGADAAKLATPPIAFADIIRRFHKKNREKPGGT